jgi:hypothetical protein
MVACLICTSPSPTVRSSAGKPGSSPAARDGDAVFNGSDPSCDVIAHRVCLSDIKLLSESTLEPFFARSPLKEATAQG